MRVYVDLDNTVAETSMHEINVSKIMFPNYGLFKEPYTKEMVKVNSFKESIRLENGTLLKDDINRCVDTVYGSEQFWKNIPVIKGSQEVLKNIQKKFGEGSVIFVTSTFDFGGENRVYDACLTGKIKWLKENFPFIGTRNIIYCGYKWLLKGDYLIEDNENQLINFSGKKILIDYPYNRWCKRKGIRRVNNWSEIRKIILGN